jgi:eukaryotic-like serine/threonine-protein kinase
MAKKKLTKVGRYKILGELGRGAMGIVYKAEDPNLDRVVALKTILLSDDAEGRKDYHKRFFLEAKAAGKLTHPHIVTTYDFGEEDDLAYLAMELLEGDDLRTRIKEGALAVADAVDIAQQVADGLGFAHERGVVHRDIKPGNIMLLPRGQAKIMDFGIARQRSADFKTSTGIVMGTPRFMSPEQVAGDPVDHRSDIFSLGTVLYEMLTGTGLFAGEDTPQIAHNVSYLEHVPPSRLNPEVPSMLDFAVARALKKDPAVRYQDAYEFAVDLRTCLAELRSRETAEKKEANGSGTRTLRSDGPASDRAPLAPAARSIASDTQLPLSRQFDSFGAVQRLAAQNRRDRKLLAEPPRPVGFLRRVARDAGPRLLFFASLLAAAAGAWVALG